MNTLGTILPTALAQFPSGGQRTVLAKSAFRLADRILNDGTTHGWDGWTHVGRPATREVIVELCQQGFTVINLQKSDAGDPFRDVEISALI